MVHWLPEKVKGWGKITRLHATQRNNKKTVLSSAVEKEIRCLNNSCHRQGHGGHVMDHKHQYCWKVYVTGLTLSGTSWLKTPKLKLFGRVMPGEYIMPLMKIKITWAKAWHMVSVSFLSWGRGNHSCLCVETGALSFSWCMDSLVTDRRRKKKKKGTFHH